MRGFSSRAPAPQTPRAASAPANPQNVARGLGLLRGAREEFRILDNRLRDYLRGFRIWVQAIRERRPPARAPRDTAVPRPEAVRRPRQLPAGIRESAGRIRAPQDWAAEQVGQTEIAIRRSGPELLCGIMVRYQPERSLTMSDTMGTFRIEIEIENPTRPGERAGVSGLLVDTGSELTWVPAPVLEALRIGGRKLSRFRQASGSILERWTGLASIYVAGTWTGEGVVFGEGGRLGVVGGGVV